MSSKFSATSSSTASSLLIIRETAHTLRTPLHVFSLFSKGLLRSTLGRLGLISCCPNPCFRLGTLALNFEHDEESLIEIQTGSALACDRKVLALEVAEFLARNPGKFSNQLFLHFSLDEDSDGKARNWFDVSTFRSALSSQQEV